MPITDVAGNAVSGCSQTALAGYEHALRQLQCYIGDPVATIDAAIADSPDFVMGHAMRAWLHLLGTEPAGVPVAQAAYEAARALPASARERGHVAAIGHLVAGEWHSAARVLEDVTIEHPRDALALQTGHVIDFFIGDNRMLRDRIARALPNWSEDLPGYHAVIGMQAFGLEETGDYARAEALGRKAILMEPRDGWSQHAVAHVMEMQGRQADGIAWMRANPEAWSNESFFCVHNWWHLALYHLELDEIDQVLALYDGPVYGARSPLALDMVDASALLWRLHLRGVDVGERWQRLADNWQGIAPGSYAFNDMHAMMAYAGAGRREAMQEILRAQRAAMEQTGDNAMFTRVVGAAVSRAIMAFGEGRYGEAVQLIRPVRNEAHRFGGSHAQRDVLDLTLIEAAIRDGQYSLAEALARERLGAKPGSPTGLAFLRRASAKDVAAAT